MCRALLVFGVVGLIALATGCTMCAHPYDYCGPTFMGQCGDSCAPDARAGSILSDTIEPISDIEMPTAEMIDAGIVDGQVLPTVHGPIAPAGHAPWQAVGPYPPRSASRAMRAPTQPRWR